MKQDNFERLKAICEKEGFDISKGSIGDIDGWFVINKKTDPWEGVEFVERISKGNDNKSIIGEIKKLPKPFIDGEYYHPFNYDYWYFLRVFKPSTETAYVDQLKKEAFERFGEIKEGDRFKDPNGSEDKANYGFKEFEYDKPSDSLYFRCVKLYEQGKWAERVKERVEITHIRSYASSNDIHYFGFRHNTDGKFSKVGQFLASQLEKFLNGEIE